MKKMIWYMFAVVFISSSCLVTFAAETIEKHCFDEVGIKIGYGGDNWALTPWDNSRNDYMTGSVSGYFANQFYHSENGTSSYFFEPIYQQAVGANFEAGINAGVQYRYKFTEKVAGFGFFGIGPHYSSILTEAKPSSNGFNIELVFGAGAYYFLSEKESISFSANITHTSNGRFFFPNYMNNDVYGEIGYSIFYN
ncbi:MAG: hypothetical protein WCV63_10685 [Negativicutes bacterium]|jgi:hypothetical protein